MLKDFIKVYKEELIVITIGIIGLTVLFMSGPSVKNTKAGQITQNVYSGNMTQQTTYTIGVSKTGSSVASSTLVAASNSGRQLLMLENVSSNPGVPITCLLGGNATSSTNLVLGQVATSSTAFGIGGIVLDPRASSTIYARHIFDNNNLYTDNVYCFAVGTSTLNVLEK